MLTLGPPPWNAAPVVRSDFMDVGRRFEGGRLLTSTAADHCYGRRLLSSAGPCHSTYDHNRLVYYQLVWLDVNSDNGEVEQQRPGGGGVFLRRRRRRYDEPGDGESTRQGEHHPAAAAASVPRGAEPSSAGPPPVMTAGELLLATLLLRGSTSGERNAFRMRPILAFLRRIGGGRWRRDATSGERTGAARRMRGEKRESTGSGGETVTKRQGVERDEEMSLGNSVEIPTKRSKRIENFQRQEVTEAEHRFANTEKERGSHVIADLQSVREEDASETQPLIANDEYQRQGDGRQREFVSVYVTRRRPSHRPRPINTRLTTRKDTFDSLVRDRRTDASNTIETKSVTRKRRTLSQGGHEWTEVSSVVFSTLCTEETQLETTPENLSSRTQRLRSPRSRVPSVANRQTDIVDDPWKTDGHQPAIEEEEEEEEDCWLGDDSADVRFCLRGHEEPDDRTTTHICRLRRRSRIQRRLKTETTGRLGRSTFTVVTSLEDLSLELEVTSRRRRRNQDAADCPPGSAANTERNSSAVKPPMEGDDLSGIADVADRSTGERGDFSDGDQRRCPGIEIVTSGDDDGEGGGGSGALGQRTTGRRNASNNARPSPRSVDGHRQAPPLGERPAAGSGSTKRWIGADRERKLLEDIQILETQQAFCLVLIIGAYIILSIVYSKLE